MRNSLKMATVKYCFISSDVYFVCMQHALSTETEEIMGLLIGYTDETRGHCHVTHTKLLKRLDKRKDRVEISPELLATSIEFCDNLNSERDRQMRNNDGTNGDEQELPLLRVVGWYHSHPHITVFPSEVDLRTQDQYQTGADPMWIGLIFGVYNAEESSGLNKLQYIAFQSVHKDHTGRLVQALIPVMVEPNPSLPVPHKVSLQCLETLLEILFTEEMEAYAKKQVEIANAAGGSQLQNGPQEQQRPPGFATVDGDPLANLQNVSTFSKNVCKIIRNLVTPMLDVLHNSMLPNNVINNERHREHRENK